MGEKIWLKQYPPEVPHQIEYPEVSLIQLLEDTVQDFPDRDAIYFMGKRITYKRLWEDVCRFANVLIKLGVQRGDRVAIMLPNCPQAIISYYGALMMGAIVVQTNPMYVERELEHQLNDSGAETIICLDILYRNVKKVKERTPLKRIITTSIKDYLPFPKNILYPLTLIKEGLLPNIELDNKINFAFLPLLKKEPPIPRKIEIDPKEEIALLQYTGGTTGLAKGAMLTHRNLVVNTLQAAKWLYKTKRGSHTKIMGALPFFHVYGMTVVMNFAIYHGATMILVPKFDRDMILDLIHKHRPQLFPGAPTMYIALINHPKISQYDLSSIDACLSGSAPLPLEVEERFEKLTGGRLIEGYGMTEASPVTHSNLIWDRKKSGTIGLPWPDTDCRVVDIETGEELGAGEVGELHVKGPQVMKGYWNRPEETKKYLVDGWFHTGDIVKMDEEGYFYTIDRKKDMIIAGGYNIYPREIEEVLYEHPAIEAAAVIGIPDPYRGETVKAFVVLKPGKRLTEEELDQYCRSKLSKYKVPRFYEFRNELPMTMIGKVLRRVLQEEERAKEDKKI